MVNKWTTDEVEFLYDNYAIKGISYCAEILDRTKNSVSLKAFRENLKVEKPCSSTARTTEQYSIEIKDRAKPLEPYVNRDTKILHQCIKGHIWKVSPASLIKGCGCPSCAKHGFSQEKPALVYFIKFEYKDMLYYKIGITNRTVKERYKDECISFEILWELNCLTGKEAQSIETNILRDYRSFIVNENILKTGNSEIMSVYINKPMSLE